MKDYSITISNGNKFYHKNGLYHREGGPAIEFISGNKFWFK